MQHVVPCSGAPSGAVAEIRLTALESGNEDHMSSARRQARVPQRAPFTPLQGQYLSVIDGYQRIHGRSPAEADLERHFAVTAPSVHRMILTLEQKGLIARVPGVARSITLRISPARLPLLDPIRAPKPDRATEYVNSPLMTQRLRRGRHISARVEGRYGVYRTHLRLTRKVDGDCTCPSEAWPCKHIRALRATWDMYPETFLDVDELLRGFKTREKTELIAIIGQIVVEFPRTLAFLGVPGFEAGDDDDGGDDDRWLD
jgi:DNA-binding MarR family transcriptional regulator